MLDKKMRRVRVVLEADVEALGGEDAGDCLDRAARDLGLVLCPMTDGTRGWMLASSAFVDELPPGPVPPDTERTLLKDAMVDLLACVPGACPSDARAYAEAFLHLCHARSLWPAP